MVHKRQGNAQKICNRLIEQKIIKNSRTNECILNFERCITWVHSDSTQKARQRQNNIQSFDWTRETLVRTNVRMYSELYKFERRLAWVYPDGTQKARQRPENM
jgi:predicted transcriptional regulator